MTVKDLVNEQALLNDTIYQLKNKILEETVKRDSYEAKIWTETDFKKLGYTNESQRKAYVKQQMGQYIVQVGSLKNDLNLAENELSLCKTKIKLCMELGIDFDEKPEE